MTPKSETERIFRHAVLDLAAGHGFARRMVNSGRLSLPCSLELMPLQTPAESGRGVPPGRVCPDAPLCDAHGQRSYLLEHLGGTFKLLALGAVEVPDGLEVVRVGPGGLADADGLVEARYGSDLVYLVRPDQHVAARFERPTAAALAAALSRARGKSSGTGRAAA
jgi:3-(3-hydroxy-phenyl)propionate hydroxylase